MTAMDRFYSTQAYRAEAARSSHGRVIDSLVRHAFFAAPRALVFAHRGGSALAPENTIAAFDNGIALGADGLELDVHLSRDGEVVVHHDRLLDRTTALRGAVADR